MSDKFTDSFLFPSNVAKYAVNNISSHTPGASLYDTAIDAVLNGDGSVYVPPARYGDEDRFRSPAPRPDLYTTWSPMEFDEETQLKMAIEASLEDKPTQLVYAIPQERVQHRFQTLMTDFRSAMVDFGVDHSVYSYQHLEYCRGLMRTNSPDKYPEVILDGTQVSDLDSGLALVTLQDFRVPFEVGMSFAAGMMAKQVVGPCNPGERDKWYQAVLEIDLINPKDKLKPICLALKDFTDMYAGVAFDHAEAFVVFMRTIRLFQAFMTSYQWMADAANITDINRYFKFHEYLRAAPQHLSTAATHPRHVALEEWKQRVFKVLLDYKTPFNAV